MKPLTLTGNYDNEEAGSSPRKVIFGMVSTVEVDRDWISVVTITGRSFSAKPGEHSGFEGKRNIDAVYAWRLGK